jgi:hypothetical protein
MKECTEAAIEKAGRGEGLVDKRLDLVDFTQVRNGAYNDNVQDGGYCPAGFNNQSFPNAGCGGGGYYSLGGGDNIRTTY